MIELTIVIPVFNGWPYIEDCVNSILDQTYQDFKLLIINDGSTDYTTQYLTSLKDSRIEVIHKKNTGVIDSMNIGFQEVKSKYLARVDADDIVHPQKFEKQISFIEKNPECILVGTDAVHMSEDKKKTGWRVKMPSSHEAIENALFSRKSAIIQPTMVCRSSCIHEIGGYRMEAWPEDYDLYFRLLGQGRFANINECLYYIRLHPNSITQKGLIGLQKGYDNLVKRYSRKETKEDRDSMFHVIYKFADFYSVYYYRKALTLILNGKSLIGYLFLFLSIILSPARALNYLKRKIGS